MGLLGTSLLASAITASERPSPSGPSITVMYVGNSTTMLLCDPPPTNQIPSPSFCDCTRMDGTLAVLTPSGTERLRPGLTFMLLTVSSNTGDPPCFCTIVVGNFTPLKSL